MKESAFMEAFLAGKRTYVSSIPCDRHGATPLRYSKNKGCVECCKESARKHYLKGAGRLKTLRVQVHVEDEQLVQMFVNQLLEKRQCK